MKVLERRAFGWRAVRLSSLTLMSPNSIAAPVGYSLCSRAATAKPPEPPARPLGGDYWMQGTPQHPPTCHHGALSARPAASQELPGYGGDGVPLLGVVLFITGAGICSFKPHQRGLSFQPGLPYNLPTLRGRTKATLGPSSPCSRPQAARRRLGLEGEMKATMQLAAPHSEGQGGCWVPQRC